MRLGCVALPVYATLALVSSQIPGLEEMLPVVPSKTMLVALTSFALLAQLYIITQRKQLQTLSNLADRPQQQKIREIEAHLQWVDVMASLCCVPIIFPQNEDSFLSTTFATKLLCACMCLVEVPKQFTQPFERFLGTVSSNTKNSQQDEKQDTKSINSLDLLEKMSSEGMLDENGRPVLTSRENT